MTGNRALYRSPLGAIEVVADKRLRGVRLLDGEGESDAPTRTAATAPYLDALEQYFAGEDPELKFPRLDLSGRTDFQRRVYWQLMRMGWGELTTYAELARAAGSPGGARAVGQALSRNPTPIFVPCHRVVTADGRPGGFSAGRGWKKRLLEFEGHCLQDERLVRRTPENTTTPERMPHRD